MEKTNVEKITKEYITHSFYCDECDKFLGTSPEHEDGWYTEMGGFELSFCLDDEWYKIEKHLCDECKEKVVERVKNSLLNLGFERDLW